MPRTQLTYRPYDELADLANVIVDGSPTAATTLTISHWPGMPAPPADVQDDLSAQMAFRYLDHPAHLHGDAAAVSNNHFDQDGLVGVFALSEPEAAAARRARLEDVAAAGDFARFADRDAARASMVISAFTDPERTPFGPLPAEYGEMAAHLYTEGLGRLTALVDDVGAYRALWADEDAQLSESEAAIASGAARIDEHLDVDLAVVTLTRPERWGGHRFGGRRYEGIHPMALHNATDRGRILLVGDGLCRFTYRYETWVQYRSRRLPLRADLAPLADTLTAVDSVAWQADPVGDLTPELQPVDATQSSLDPAEVTKRLVEHLRTAPPSFDPYGA